jgi:hypothetical protein
MALSISPKPGTTVEAKQKEDLVRLLGAKGKRVAPVGFDPTTFGL